MNLVVARGWKACLLRKAKLAAVTMPWSTVYILPEYLHNKSLVKHEAVHLWQIHRDGAWRFAALYAWWLLVHGYHANPYEIEAYALAPIVDEPLKRFQIANRAGRSMAQL